MKKEIYIIMITPELSKDGGGGIANYTQILAKELSLDFEVKRVVTLRERGILNRATVLLFATIKVFYLLSTKKRKIAHIHTAHDYSFFRKSIFVKLCKLFKTPVILHLHSHSFGLSFKNKSHKQQESIRKVFKLADKVIVLHEKEKEWYLDNIEKRPPLVIYNGMDDLMTSNDKVSQRKNKILFLGELGHRKGTYDLIKAFKKVLENHLDAKLILAGDGEIDECKKLVKSLQIDNSIEFLGWIGLERKRELLNSSKIFVLPSHQESFPLTILEAMSTRLPIISTFVGGIPEEIENNVSGVLINAGDIEALSKNISRLLEDNSLCDTIGQGGRERYLKYFRLNKITKDIENIYRELYLKEK